MRLFLLDADKLAVYQCDARAALRLDARGVPVPDDTWVASLVTFAPSSRAPEHHALITRPGTTVTLGPDRLVAGIAAVAHSDHVFFGSAEAILDGDAVPRTIDDGTADEPCPVCRLCRGSEGRAALLACPRCGARACDVCWSSAPGGRCLTAGCEQPAARDRPLTEPLRSDFCTWLDDHDAADGKHP